MNFIMPCRCKRQVRQSILLFCLVFFFSACHQVATIIPETPDQRLTERERLQLELARMHFANHDYTLARQEYVRLVLNHPGTYVREVAQFMIGESFFQEGDCPQAERYFLHYILDFPSGYKRSESDVRLKECSDQRAEAEAQWSTPQLRQAAPVVTAPSALSKSAISSNTKDPRRAFRTTWYWIENEKDYQPKVLKPLISANGEVLKQVPETFLKRILVEGTGRLNDGRVVNWVSPGRFQIIDVRQAPFGFGSQQQPLVPLRTIAVDRQLIALGTVVYIPEFDGLEVGAGVRHDGCFVAGDVGSAIRGYHIDIFSPTYAQALDLMSRVPERLALHQSASHCRKEYAPTEGFGAGRNGTPVDSN